MKAIQRSLARKDLVSKPVQETHLPFLGSFWNHFCSILSL